MTSLKSFPSEWELSSIESFVLNKDGSRQPISVANRQKIQGTFPYYGATGKIDSLNNFTHEGEHVLIGEDGANLLSKSKDLAFIVSGQFWVNNHAHAVQCLADVPAQFVSNFINSLDLSPYITGSAQPKLTKTNLGKIKIPIPPLAEQKQIATQLDNLLAQVDTLKNRLDAISTHLKRFRQSVLAAAVSGKLTEDWRESNELLNWDNTAFENVISQANNGISKRKGEDGKEITVLRLADFKNAKRIYGKEREITLTAKEQEKYILSNNELLTIRVNGSVDLAGLFILYTKKGEDEAFCDHFIRFNVDPTKINPKFLTFITNEGVGRHYLRNSLSTSAGQNTINQKSIKALPLNLPPIEEQTEIVTRVKTLFSFADKIESHLKQAQEQANNLTPSLLAKAFRGDLTAEWRKQNPDLITGENSAEALLARIKAEQEKLKPKRKTRKKKA